MADDTFPTPDPTPVRDSIGDVEYVLVFPVNGDPYARYSIQILDPDGNVVDVEQGFLFQTGGPDHLTGTEKTNLVNMDTRLQAKAASAFL